MSSQLNVDAIVDKAGSGGTNVKIGNTSTYVSDGSAGTSNLVQGLVKACAMIDPPNDFSGGANSTYYTINVASLTDDSTGNFTLTMTNAFSAITSRIVTTGAVLSNKLTAFNGTGSSTAQIKLQATDADTDSEQDQVLIASAIGDLA